MAGSLGMTKDEREAFLADVRVGIIAIDEEGRAPIAVPVWYSYEPGGDVAVLMQGDSRKMQGIEASGRFSLCVQTETAPYRYVSVEGPMSSVRPYGHDDILAMATRYLGEEMGAVYAKGGGGGNSVMVSMTPERWSTTDYSKR